MHSPVKQDFIIAFEDFFPRSYWIISFLFTVELFSIFRRFEGKRGGEMEGVLWLNCDEEGKDLSELFRCVRWEDYTRYIFLLKDNFSFSLLLEDCCRWRNASWENFFDDVLWFFFFFCLKSANSSMVKWI